METTGIITDIAIDYKTRKSKISLLLDTKDIEIVEQLKNENKLKNQIPGALFASVRVVCAFLLFLYIY